MEVLIPKLFLTDSVIYEFNYKHPGSENMDGDSTYTRAIIIATANPIATWQDIVEEYNSIGSEIMETATRILGTRIVSFTRKGFANTVRNMFARDKDPRPFEHYIEYLAKELVMRRDHEQYGGSPMDHWPKD